MSKRFSFFGAGTAYLFLDVLIALYDTAGRALIGTGDAFELPQGAGHRVRSYQTGTPGILSRVRNTE